MKKESIRYIVYLHLLMLFYSFGTVCSKLASGYPVLSKEFIVLYAAVIAILGIYAILWQQILKKMSLITAYANKAVTVIWGLVWGCAFFKEQLKVINIVGAAIIIAGVYFVVTGEEK